jgi:hypothetical protein
VSYSQESLVQLHIVALQLLANLTRGPTS